jgi:diguanylate cyclase (GGDEF)-like protein
LRETVTRQVGAGSVDIMVPDGEGKFVVRGDSVPDRGGLTLDRASELCELIMKSARPVPLPLAGSGIGRGEPFLDAAIAAGIVVASAIRAGGETACILLIGEKGDNPQYSNQDMDFIYVVSNIASLALDNIYQYSTIEKLSYTDSMTGVFNYRYFYKRLNEEILRAKRYERELSLVILDIDNFKSFNDNFGHQAGDLILRQLSDLITRTIRSIDVVSRYGGEEFCIIMPDTGIGNCAVFIERLRSHIAEFKFESELFVKGSNITVSVGGAVYPHQALTPDRLIYCADMALLKAKSIGRNKAIMYEPEFSLDVNSAEGGINESHQESIF